MRLIGCSSWRKESTHQPHQREICLRLSGVTNRGSQQSRKNCRRSCKATTEASSRLRRSCFVDDGSTDETRDILESAARIHPWITLVTRPDRGFRKSGGGVVEAFDDGYRMLRDADWDFIGKLDGDLTFAPEYFAACLAQFAEDARLGIGGGTILVLENGQCRVDSAGDPPFHVRGATKIYRRACWDQISPLVRAPGWDTIDEVKANMHGWSTRSFAGVCLVQQRATGAADGNCRNWFKNGVANYVTGYHPIFMLGKCVKRVPAKPRVLSALALWIGFCSGYVRRLPQVDDARAVRYLRQQQVRRLLLKSSIYGSSRNVDQNPAGRDSRGVQLSNR